MIIKAYPEPALLDDPDYEPKHPPVNGQVPTVVAKWGPRSQVRWFQRFRRSLKSFQSWGQWHVESLLHLDTCCWRCVEGDESDYWEGPGCCCRGYSACKSKGVF